MKLVFDDGHDTGLYTWKYLHELGREHAGEWARYLERKRAGARWVSGDRRGAEAA